VQIVGNHHGIKQPVPKRPAGALFQVCLQKLCRGVADKISDPGQITVKQHYRMPQGQIQARVTTSTAGEVENLAAGGNESAESGNPG
jgi:hypothetical protein